MEAQECGAIYWPKRVPVMRLLLLLLLAGVAVCQTPNDAPVKTEKVDKAAAYYHYMLAYLYADTRDPGNEAKISEHLKAARQADPEAPASIPRRQSFPVIFDHAPRPLPPPER